MIDLDENYEKEIDKSLFPITRSSLIIALDDRLYLNMLHKINNVVLENIIDIFIGTVFKRRN